MRKVLIFGVSGFVGNYLIQEFLDNGYEVFGTDKEQNIDICSSVEFTKIDLLNRDDVEYLINKIVPDIIINLAAISSVGLSWKMPQQTMQVNVIGALNIMEATRKCSNNPKILFVGSREEYIGKKIPLNEKSDLNASNPYGISKVTQEQLASIYRKQYGMKIYCVRPFNHTGVGQKDTFVLPSFCKQVVEIEKSGRAGMINVGNIKVKRDFSHVKDVVRAYRMIVESDNCNAIYNVGTGVAYSLEELLDYILKKSTQKIEIKCDKERIRLSDEPVICCNHDLITKELGWKPQYSVYDALDEIIENYRIELGVDI